MRIRALPRRLAIGLACTLSTIAAADDWNVGPGGNPNRDAYSAEVGPTAPSLLWAGSLSGVVAQQAVSEGDFVVMARIQSLGDTLNGTTLVCHNLNTGATAWTQQLPIDFPATDWRSRISAVRDGRVFATRAGNTNQSYLYALDLADGSILWKSQDLIDETTTEGLSFASNGDLVIGNFASLMRVRSGDGTTVWKVPRISPTSDGSSCAVFGDRGYIWEATGGGPAVAVHDLVTGAKLYSGPPIGGGLVQQLGLLVGPDGTVYAPRTQNNAATDFFVAYDDTGAALVERWRAALGYVPFATFAVGRDGSVYTYNVVQQGGNALLTIVRRSPVNGAVLNTSATYTVNFPVQPRIATDADGKLFLTNGGFSLGRLYSFNDDLSERWTVAISNVNVGGPVLGERGTLVVCGVGADVRAYRTPRPCPLDFDRDGSVGQGDLALLLSAYAVCSGQPGYDPDMDVDGSGCIDQGDLAALLAEYGSACP